MADDNFFADLNDEMQELKANEDISFWIDLIFKEYKEVKEFIATLPDNLKPLDKEKTELSGNFYITENGFILENTKVFISKEKIVISLLTDEFEYSKDIPVQNSKLLEQTAEKIKKFSDQYRSAQSQKIEEDHKKMIEALENF